MALIPKLDCCNGNRHSSSVIVADDAVAKAGEAVVAVSLCARAWAARVSSLTRNPPIRWRPL